jgi:hypothetical protein
MCRYFLAVVTVLAGLTLPSPVLAREPGWVGNVVLPQPQRAVIEKTPMIRRPYRPFHFYGNTVRRMHYHGRLWPTPMELGEGMNAFLGRRATR